MEFLPWKTFGRIVARYGGDDRVRTLNCGEQYRVMAFAQLTYRERLPDIETWLSVEALKLSHMGLRKPIRRSTLADATASRDWRIYADLAQRLIAQARKLYATEDLGLDLTNSVYALDSTTIDLCLSVFPWAHFRTTKAAVKMTPCSICAATSRASFTCRMANWPTCMRSICCFPKPVPSMLWIVAM